MIGNDPVASSAIRYEGTSRNKVSQPNRNGVGRASKILLKSDSLILRSGAGYAASLHHQWTTVNTVMIHKQRVCHL